MKKSFIFLIKHFSSIEIKETFNVIIRQNNVYVLKRLKTTLT